MSNFGFRRRVYVWVPDELTRRFKTVLLPMGLTWLLLSLVIGLASVLVVDDLPLDGDAFASGISSFAGLSAFSLACSGLGMAFASSCVTNSQVNVYSMALVHLTLNFALIVTIMSGVFIGFIFIAIAGSYDPRFDISTLWLAVLGYMLFPVSSIILAVAGFRVGKRTLQPPAAMLRRYARGY